MDKLVSDLFRRHQIPKKSYAIKKFSDELETMFTQQFSTSLSFHDMHRTRQDLKLLLSIKQKLRKLPVIIRQSDKSGVLHIGYKSDYERKVLAYQEKTKAYVELALKPLEETFFKAVRLLNDLISKQLIKVWQHKRMMPEKNKLQLSYLYFVPKPHKVFLLYFR